MVLFVAGVFIFGVFDFMELLKKTKSHEKIIYAIFFAATLIFGIWYFSNFFSPSLTEIFIDLFKLNEVNFY